MNLSKKCVRRTKGDVKRTFNTKVDTRPRKVQSLIIVLFVLTFISCEKESQTIIPEPVLVEATSENHQKSFTDFDMFELKTLKVTEINMMNRGTLLLQQQISFSANDYKVYYLNKSNMDANKIYFIEVTPYSGNPDVYVFGYSPYRPINYSKNTHGIDDTYVAKSDLRNSEYQARFVVHAKTACSALVKIYSENTSCSMNVPLHIQNNNWSCGHQSVRMVLDYYGAPPSITTLYNQMGWDYSDANDREAAIEANSNLNAGVGVNWTFQQLENKLCEGKPVIAGIWRHNLAHSVVVTEIDANDVVHFNDSFYNSNGGEQTLSKSTFLNRWNLNNHFSYHIPPPPNIVTFIH